MGVLLWNVYQRNLLYQQVGFKWRSYFYLRELVGSIQSADKFRKTLVISVFFLVYLLDFALGCTLLLLIREYSLQGWMKDAISTYTLSILHWTEQLVTWLMGFPAGLKLNTPLDHFLGTRFLTILEFWEYFYIDFIASYMTGILSLILLLSPFGVTVFLTALHDFLKFLNLCLICFFIFTLRIFTLQISALKSLARLFMGKKWNVLRKRVDSCDYDTSQLLMGTVLFTILLFLVPTTGMYFLIFLLLRLLQFAVQFLLRLAAVLVNKTTVTCWRMLHSLLQDVPITKVHVTLAGGGHQRSKVILVWNGRGYSVEEMRVVLMKYPPQEVLSDLGGGCHGDGKFRHPMIKWIGPLPLSLRAS